MMIRNEERPMSKLLLPMFVGVFVGAFVVEILRRNNPELGDALQAKARRVMRALPQALKPKGELARGNPPTTA
jgi:hypothetical protein